MFLDLGTWSISAVLLYEQRNLEFNGTLFRDMDLTGEKYVRRSTGRFFISDPE
jgi:hypothetical protein